MVPLDTLRQQKKYESYRDMFLLKGLNLVNVNVSPGGFYMIWLLVNGAVYSASQFSVYNITTYKLERAFKQDRPHKYNLVMANNHIDFGHGTFLTHLNLGGDSCSAVGKHFTKQLLGEEWNKMEDICPTLALGVPGGSRTPITQTFYNLRSPIFVDQAAGCPPGINVIHPSSILLAVSARHANNDYPQKELYRFIMDEKKRAINLFQFALATTDQEEAMIEDSLKLFIMPRSFSSENTSLDLKTLVKALG
ncbi:hypothetical protein JCM16303_004676 [Sporobolomyces ruberrimus]